MGTMSREDFVKTMNKEKGGLGSKIAVAGASLADAWINADLSNQASMVNQVINTANRYLQLVLGWEKSSAIEVAKGLRVSCVYTAVSDATLKQLIDQELKKANLKVSAGDMHDLSCVVHDIIKLIRVSP